MTPEHYKRKGIGRMKTFYVLFAVYALIGFAVVGGIAYIILHFVAKFW